MKKMVIFDLDGTLLDTSEGIIKCHMHAHQVMGKDSPCEKTLRDVIGGPLLDTYINKFKFAPDDARMAVEAYRKRYSEKGIYEAYIYSGIEELLSKLKNDGFMLMVATLKKEEFAKKILDKFEIAKYFDCIFGVDDKDVKKKADLLAQCVESKNISFSEAVLVGDSEYDFEGAKKCNMDFVGVTYGFGFKNCVDNSFALCDDTEQAYNAIISLK